jgi:hypothetical protein
LEDILFYEIVKHDSSYWISSIGIFEMNALGKIIHYIPKHSLKFGLLQTINLLKRLLMLVLGYMTIFTVLEALIFPVEKAHLNT